MVLGVVLLSRYTRTTKTHARFIYVDVSQICRIHSGIRSRILADVRRQYTPDDRRQHALSVLRFCHGSGRR